MTGQVKGHNTVEKWTNQKHSTSKSNASWFFYGSLPYKPLNIYHYATKPLHTLQILLNASR